jgi:iron complex transport system substrate-binding protein
MAANRSRLTGRRALAGALLVLLLLSPSLTRPRELVDMIGRRVTVPDRVERVAALSPPATYLVYAFDPGLLVGLNFPLREGEKRFTAEAYRALPVLGGMEGNGRNVNLEVLLAARPDVVLLWTRGKANDAINEQYERLLAPLNLPLVHVRFDGIADYPAAISSWGRSWAGNSGPRS